MSDGLTAGVDDEAEGAGIREGVAPKLAGLAAGLPKFLDAAEAAAAVRAATSLSPAAAAATASATMAGPLPILCSGAAPDAAAAPTGDGMLPDPPPPESLLGGIAASAYSRI